MPHRLDAASATSGITLARAGVRALLLARRQRLRLLVALVGAVAILGAQQFLTVHALHHLGQTDHSHCEYAPLAAAAGGAVLCAALALAPPVPAVDDFPAPRLPCARSAATIRQARGPPSA